MNETDPGFQKYRDEILESLLQQQHQHCDLDVICSDGRVQVHGIVFASLLPALHTLGPVTLDNTCVIIPDITKFQLITFLQCLYNVKLRELNQNAVNIIRNISSLLGCKSLDFSEISKQSEKIVICKEADGGDDSFQDDLNVPSPESVSNSSLNASLNTSLAPVAEETNKNTRLSLINLTQIDIEGITDEVLSNNFSDQEGRLVCLVCYRLHGAQEHNKFRNHIKQHDKSSLERVKIEVPLVGKGGPGLKKKFLSDAELEKLFCHRSELVCNKCDKHFPLNDKTNFRKHLAYHNLKEKKYLYQCPKCPLKFTDNSNLKRHILSIHDRQVFRCLHCDFEDNRKKRLQDHMNNAHNDRVQHEEISLDKGEGPAAIADLTANEAPLTSFNPPDDAQNVFLDNSKSSIPNILQKYSYQCTGCKFRKRKLAAVEDHIKEVHADCPDLMIRKIALKAKDGNEQIFACKFCDATFKKKTLLNQHNYKVHEIQLDTEYTCSQCGVSCANLPGLKAHTRAHLAKKFLCANCNKSFLILSQLKDHVDRAVCMEETRKCQHCEKVFSTKHRLELHLRVHNNDKPYECNICKKAFTQTRSLKEHLLTHKSERQFKCQFCDKKFVQKNHLKYHLTSQHSQNVSDLTKHTCQTCGKAFPFPYQLKRHEKIHVNISVAKARERVLDETSIPDVTMLACGEFPDLSLSNSNPPPMTMLTDLGSSQLNDIVSNIDLETAIKSVNTPS